MMNYTTPFMVCKLLLRLRKHTGKFPVRSGPDRDTVDHQRDDPVLQVDGQYAVFHLVSPNSDETKIIHIYHKGNQKMTKQQAKDQLRSIACYIPEL